MKKYLFLSYLLILFLIPVVKAQGQSVTFLGEKSDFLILKDNYAEFRFDSYYGGGRVKQRKNKIVIENDHSYSGRSKSTYFFEANNRVIANIHKFFVRDIRNSDVSEKAFMILAIVHNKPLAWAESRNGYYEFPVKPIPENTIAWLHSFEYHPLKIILDNYPSGTFHITLAENDSSGIFAYMPADIKRISCRWQGKDKLVCSFKHHGPGYSPVKRVLFRQ